MKYIVFLLFFSTLVLGDNPKAFSALGDNIYNSFHKIMKLKDIEPFKKYSRDIDSYVFSVSEIKKIGFNLDNNKNTSNKESYLNSLRTLDKKYNFYLGESNREFNNAIENEDTELFNALLQTELIDINQNKKTVLEYYGQHKEDVLLTPTMQKMLEQERQKKFNVNNASNSIEQDRVQRIRESYKRKEAKLEKELQEENMKKKLEIRNHQKEELSI